MTKVPPKAPPPNTITVAARFQNRNLKEIEMISL